MDGVEDVGTALVAQSDDGRECQVVGSGVGHARDAGLVTFLLQDFLQGEALAQVRLRLPGAGAVALRERIDDHIAVVAVIAAVARVDIDVGLLGGGGVHGKNRCQRHDD